MPLEHKKLAGRSCNCRPASATGSGCRTSVLAPPIALLHGDVHYTVKRCLCGTISVLESRLCTNAFAARAATLLQLHISHTRSAQMLLAVLIALLLCSKVGGVEQQQCSNESDRTAKSAGRFAFCDEVHGNMANIRDVMLLLGYQETSSPADANVIWCWRYPFTASSDSAETPPGLHTAYKVIKTGLGQYQFVNQLPGIGSITTKSELGKLARVLKFIPQTYTLPEDYDAWQEAISNAKEQGVSLDWMQKDPEHRGIRIVENAQSSHLANRTQGILVQELVRPYLIGNRLWDFGVYVGITQLEPLMVYIYTGSVLLRFCKIEYVWNITNDTDPASYVIYGLENVHRSGKEVPEMETHYKGSGTDSTLSSTMSLAAICSYLASQGVNTTAWWLDVQSKIVQVLQHAAPAMAQGLRYNYPGSRVNFFTLLRFDFMFDHHQRNGLIEVNMSPGLHRHDVPRSDQLLSRKLVHDLVTLKGLAPAGYHHLTTGQDLAAIKYHADGTAVGEPSCAGGCDTVADCTSKPECMLCRVCRSQWQNNMLSSVMAEHLNSHDYMRIHPPGIALASYMKADNVDIDSYFDPHVRPDDAVVRAWLEHKCASDYRWC